MISLPGVRYYVCSYALAAMILGWDDSILSVIRWGAVFLAGDLLLFGLEARRHWYEMKLESLSRRT